MTRKEAEKYEYGKFNESNSNAAICIYLQERLSKEKYLAIGMLDKATKKITHWEETFEDFGGDIIQELY